MLPTRRFSVKRVTGRMYGFCKNESQGLGTWMLRLIDQEYNHSFIMARIILIHLSMKGAVRRKNETHTRISPR